MVSLRSPIVSQDSRPGLRERAVLARYSRGQFSMIERGQFYVSVDIAASEAPFRSGVALRKLGIEVTVTVSALILCNTEITLRLEPQFQYSCTRSISRSHRFILMRSLGAAFTGQRQLHTGSSELDEDSGRNMCRSQDSYAPMRNRQFQRASKYSISNEKPGELFELS